MQYLKKDEAITVLVGPFLDNADFVTPETGLLVGTVDEISLYKEGSVVATDITGTTTFTHVGGGLYSLTLSASNVDTAGRLLAYIRDDSDCLPILAEFTVLPEQVYDSLISGDDVLQVDVIEIANQAAAATTLRKGLEAITTGAVSGTATTTLIPTGLTESTDDHYNGRVITFTSGPLEGQSSNITDYDGTNKRLTVNELTEAPNDGDEFTIS